MRPTTAPAFFAAALALAVGAGPALADGHGAHGFCRDVTPVRLEVLALDRLHAALSGRFGYDAGFVPLLADDVVLLVPHQPILQGKAAARDYYASLDPAERLSWTPTRIDASADGAMGTMFGWTVATTPAADGTTTTVNGKNMVVWKRTARGWRVAVYFQAASGPPKPTPAGFNLFPDERVRCATLGDADATTRAVEDADIAFAADSVANGFVQGFVDYAAPDAVLRSGGALIIGPEQIGALFGDPVPPSVELLDWGPSVGGGARSGDLGWTAGVASDTVFDPAGDQVFFSKYLTFWKLQPDGRWLYVADGGNSLE